MPRADFYLIDKPRFREEPLLLVCELTKKAFAAQQPTLILTRDHEQAHALDELLWAFDDDAMIPHQLAGDDDDADTAVLIVPPGVETEDRPLLINLREGCPGGTIPARAGGGGGGSGRTRWFARCAGANTSAWASSCTSSTCSQARAAAFLAPTMRARA